MGQELCKGCESGCLLAKMEGDFSKKSNYPPEKNIATTEQNIQRPLTKTQDFSTISEFNRNTERDISNNNNNNYDYNNHNGLNSYLNTKNYNSNNNENNLNNINGNLNTINENLNNINENLNINKYQDNNEEEKVPEINNDLASSHNKYIDKISVDHSYEAFQSSKKSLKLITSTEFNKKDHQEKLSKIIYNYRLRILFKSFKIFQQKKKASKEKIIIETYNNNTSRNSLKSSKNSLSSSINGLVDIDLMPNLSTKFIGTKFGGKKEGFGIEIYEDINAKYIGFYRGGRKKGICKFTIDNEEISYNYGGEVNNDLITGYGYYQNNKNNLKYEGEWRNSVREGWGEEFYDDGSFFRGEFKHGKKYGIGVYKWVDNSFYEGEWVNNMLHGYGKYVFTDGTIYVGGWRNNKMNGLGEFTSLNNKTYLGYFSEDVKDGFGILIWTQSKKIFVGFWKNNKQNGLGKYINEDRFLYGKWKDGKNEEKFINEEEFVNKMTPIEKIYLKYFNFDDYDTFLDKISKFLMI